ncbi:MAG: N-acetylmuramoyl-L-alanine amidase, partial [Frankiales bacterium]|nr:N-acetylmuramoyl-L-alanine amidase [Frankiales bacterium]
MRVQLVATALLVAGACLTAAPAVAGTATDTTGTVYSTDRVVVPITFPVVGTTSFSDTFLSCRSGCARKHMGQDLMGPKMSPLVAACSGTVVTLKRETRVGDGNYLGIACDSGAAAGWTAMYLHVNNDTPGTDDGSGTQKWSFPTGIAEGVRVLQGQLVAWRGDSGNAETTGPHLHFELRKGTGWGGVVYDAYYSLKAAHHIAAPTASGPHPDGTLLRTPASGTYLLRDGKAYGVTPAVRAANALSIANAIPVSWAEMALYPYGGRLPVRSGALVKDPSGAVWRVSGSTRFPAVPAAGQTVTSVAAGDLGGLTVSDAPESPFFPGLLLKVGGALIQVGDDGQGHKVGAFAAASYGLRASDAVEPPLDVDLPWQGDDLGLRDGTLVSAYGVGLGVVSDGHLRRLWDTREVNAYRYTGKPRLAVLGSAVSNLTTGEMA